MSAAAVLRARIAAAGGSVAFAEFMRFALHDPEHGYYARRVRTVGRAGDFSTSATLHPALGQALAPWARFHHWGEIGAAVQWDLIELGGGTGEMAASVLRSLGWWGRRGLRYSLVETSANLREAQRRTLALWEGRVAWHDTLRGALAEAAWNPLIVSNEFVDAFPCARWVFDADAGWREIRVAWDDAAGRFAEARGEPVEAARLAAASVAGGSAVAGQRVEVFDSYRDWWREQFAEWEGRVRVLTIDYGDWWPALYHRRPDGTLRAYCRQMRFAGNEVYERVGQQDLTADVNFTDLERWGTELGFRTAVSGTQAEFLRFWLSDRQVRAARRDATLSYLLDPAGPGGAFKFLEQARG